MGRLFQDYANASVAYGGSENKVIKSGPAIMLTIMRMIYNFFPSFNKTIQTIKFERTH